MPAFDYLKAKQDGVSDEQIASFIEQKRTQGVDLYIPKEQYQSQQQPQEDKPFTFAVPDSKVQANLQRTPQKNAEIKARLQSQLAAAKKEEKQANSLIGKMETFKKEFVKGLYNTVAYSEKALGETLGKAFTPPTQIASNVSDLTNSGIKLLKAIKTAEAQGKDATKLKQSYNSTIKLIEEQKGQLTEYQQSLPTNKQVAGQAAGVGLDIATAGTYGQAARGINTGKLLWKTPAVKGLATAVSPELGQIATQKAGGLFTKTGGKNIAKGASIGYGFDVSSKMQEGKTGGEEFVPGFGTLIGTTIPAISEAGQSIKNIKPVIQKAKSKAVDSLEQTYIDLLSGTTPGKKKIAKIETKTEIMNKAGTIGKTPMRTLAEDGIIPERAGPKLDTFEQAKQYRENIKPLRDINRKALEEAKLSTVPVKLDDIEKRVLSEAATPKNVNSGRFEKMEKEINNEFNVLRKNNPSGEISLIKADDIKSARWDNVFKNKSLVEADALKKDSEYFIAQGFQKTIEETASKAGNSEVAQLNREIGDRLSASKFLEDLNGKTIKGGRLLKYVTTGIGASFGQTIPGKILGALGGNLVGEMIIANNVANPLKRLLLRNLKNSNPETYLKTIKWVETQNLDREIRLLLEAPKNTNPIINQGRPISVFPTKKNIDYLGTETVIGGIQSKSPNIQQTKPAITNVKSIPILKSITKTGEKVNIFEQVPVKNMEGVIDGANSRFIYSGLTEGETKASQKVAGVIDNPPKLGLSIEDVSKKSKPAMGQITKEASPLAQEAAQTKLFRGGFGGKVPDTYWLTTTEKNAFRFGQDAKARSMGFDFRPGIDEARIGTKGISVERFGVKRGTKLFDTRTMPLPKEILKKIGYQPKNDILSGVIPGTDRNIVNDFLKKQGYEGSIWEHSGGNVHTAVFNKNNLLTKAFEEAKGAVAKTPLGQKIIQTGEKKPTLQLKRDVTVTTLSGEKVVIDANEVLKAYESGGKALLKDGREYIVSKSQYENIKNNSLKSEAKEFAPELKGIEESVKTTEAFLTEKDLKQVIREKDNFGTERYVVEFKTGQKYIAQPHETKQTALANAYNANIRAKGMNTKFSQYQLPGGKNYKEVIHKDPKFPVKSDESHFGDAASWHRVVEQTYKGKKVYFLEEIQKGKHLDEVIGHPLGKGKYIKAEIQSALKEAVDNNSEYLAWTTGEQQAARYNLAKEVEHIQWNTTTDGGRLIQIKPKSGEAFQVKTDKMGTVSAGKADWKGKKLDEVIGKGISEKIMSSDKYGKLEGEGLNIGGEWAKNLYDKQVKNIVEDVTGGKVEVLDMRLPVENTKNSVKWLTRDKPSDNGLRVIDPKKDIKVGREISQNHGENNFTHYIITDILGEKGQFKAVPKRVTHAGKEWNYNEMPKDYQKSVRATQEQTFDISTKLSNGQQAIRLTPEIKALVRGEALKLKSPSVVHPFK